MTGSSVQLVASPLTRILLDASDASGSDGGPALARRLGEAWRDEVRAALKVHGEVPDWRETPREPASTTTMRSADLRAVRLLAVVADKTDTPWPDEVPDVLEAFPAWSKAAADDFQTTPLGQIALPDIWLPGSFRATCRTRAPWGDSLTAGSLGALREQIVLLNARTMQLDLDRADAVLDPADPVDRDFVRGAIRGLQALHRAAGEAAFAAIPLIVVEGA